MSRELGELTTEERDTILEMREPRWVAYEAAHMARVLQAALRGPDAYEISDASAWMAGKICIALDRIEDMLKRDDAKPEGMNRAALDLAARQPGAPAHD